MSAALDLPIHPRMIVASDLLGPLTVQPEELIDFPDGMLGFSECRTFALVATEREGMYWLQSAERGALAFLLVDPFLHFPAFEVEVGPAELQALSAERDSDVAVFAIVTLPEAAGEAATANLQGPLVVNLAARRAMQLVVGESKYGLREPLESLRKARA